MIRLTLIPEPAERPAQAIFGGLVTTGGGVLDTHVVRKAGKEGGAIAVPLSGDLVGDAGEWARSMMLKSQDPATATVEIKQTVEVVIGVARLGPSRKEGDKRERAVEVEWAGEKKA